MAFYQGHLGVFVGYARLGGKSSPFYYKRKGGNGISLHDTPPRLSPDVFLIWDRVSKLACWRLPLSIALGVVMPRLAQSALTWANVHTTRISVEPGLNTCLAVSSTPAASWKLKASGLFVIRAIAGQCLRETGDALKSRSIEKRRLPAINFDL